MAGYVEGVDRQQATLFPERLDELVPGDALVRVIDCFVDQLDVQAAGFIRAHCLVLGRPGSGGRGIGRAISCGFFFTAT
jgi:transposase